MKNIKYTIYVNNQILRVVQGTELAKKLDEIIDEELEKFYLIPNEQPYEKE